jgi:hypothetical protein
LSWGVGVAPTEPCRLVGTATVSSPAEPCGSAWFDVSVILGKYRLYSDRTCSRLSVALSSHSLNVVGRRLASSFLRSSYARKLFVWFFDA